jgi:hypothetical protein
MVNFVWYKALLKQTMNRQNMMVDASKMTSELLILSVQNGQKVKVIKD